MLNNRLLVSAILGFLPLAASASIYLNPGAAYISTKTTTVTYQGFAPKFGIGIDNDSPVMAPSTNSFYLGVEFVAMPMKPVTINDNSTSGVMSLKPIWTYGINILPGVNFDGVVKGFVIVGTARTSFSSGAISTGKQAGIGLEYKVTSRWAGRISYVYTAYSSMTNLNSPRSEEALVTAVLRI